MTDFIHLIQEKSSGSGDEVVKHCSLSQSDFRRIRHQGNRVVEAIQPMERSLNVHAIEERAIVQGELQNLLLTTIHLHVIPFERRSEHVVAGPVISQQLQ